MLRHPPAFLTGVLAALLAVQPAFAAAAGRAVYFPAPASVAIVAEEGSITGHGLQIAAGFDANGKPVATTDPSAGNILLSAGEEIALHSAQGSSSTDFSATSSGASFGIDLGSGLPVASGSYATGEGDGTGVYNLNSHVTGTGTVVLNSGADTVLKGAIVSGETVIANVGGDLLIESLQDTASYDEQSVGISAGFGPSGLSGGVNKGTVTGDFANVAEQSGIVAGSGGYHVVVEGGVDLVGGVIASTDTTGNSSLSADHLTFSDLRNSSSASTSNIGLSASLPLQGSDAASAPLGGLAIIPAVGQPAMESDGGTARATLTPGTLSLSNQTQDLAGLNTDLSKANTQVEIYDIEELKAKQRNAAALSELLNMGVGTLSEALGFDEGSPEKVALHAAIGALTAELAGGNAATGALAGGASEIANGILVEVLKANPNLNAAQQAAITQWVAAAVGAAVGGELGAATALDNVNYNYLKHEQEEAARKKRAALQEAYADCKANLGNGCSGEELASIEQQLIALKAEAQEQSTQNIVDLVNACGSSMTSKACMDGRAELQAALDNAGLQQGLLGSGATNTPDVLLAQVLIQADQGAIAPGGLSAAYSQALVRDQKITMGIALTAVAVAGGVIAAETYSWCMVNPNACVAIVEMASCAAAGPCDNLSAAVGNISPKAASNAADDLAALAKTRAGQGGGVATNTGERIVVRTNSAGESVVSIQGKEMSIHASQQATTRGISNESIANAMDQQPFSYVQNGQTLQGYYDASSNTFVGVGDRITTVIRPRNPTNYLNNLRNRQ